MSDHSVGGSEPPISAAEFHRVQQSKDFAELKRRFRSFAFPMTAVFLAWYLFYVLGSIFARDLMMTPVIGEVTFGLLLGIGQFISTFVITGLYVWHANKRVDPIAEQIRTELEEGRA